VRVEFAPQDSTTPQARLRIQQPAKISGVGTYQPAKSFTNEREGFTIPLGQKSTWVELTASK